MKDLNAQCLALLSCLLISAPAPAAPAADYQRFFDETFGDFPEELARARKQRVLLFFEMDDCPFCERMRTTVLNQPEVQAGSQRHSAEVIALDMPSADKPGAALTPRFAHDREQRYFPGTAVGVRLP